MERLYVGSWVFNTKRPTRDFSPGGADRNIDLAAWIEDALNNNLIALPTTESDTIYTSDGTVSENRYAQLSNNKKIGLGYFSDFPSISPLRSPGSVGPPYYGLYVDRQNTEAYVYGGYNYVSINERFGTYLKNTRELSGDVTVISGVTLENGTFIQDPKASIYNSTAVSNGNVGKSYSAIELINKSGSDETGNRFGIYLSSGIDINASGTNAYKKSMYIAMGRWSNSSDGFTPTSTIHPIVPSSNDDSIVIGGYSNSTSRDIVKAYVGSTSTFDYVKFHDKYTFPNEVPSTTDGNMSIMVWEGNNPSDTINTFKVLGSSYANSAAAITGGVAVGEIWYNTTTNKFNVRLV